jgi:copper chaperone CopZ
VDTVFTRCARLWEPPGVKVDEVRIGSASVSFDDAKTTVGDLVDAVCNAGYEANEAA